MKFEFNGIVYRGTREDIINGLEADLKRLPLGINKNGTASLGNFVHGLEMDWFCSTNLKLRLIELIVKSVNMEFVFSNELGFEFRVEAESEKDAKKLIDKHMISYKPVPGVVQHKDGIWTWRIRDEI